jgi:hypothetical protein
MIEILGIQRHVNATAAGAQIPGTCAQRVQRCRTTAASARALSCGWCGARRRLLRGSRETERQCHERNSRCCNRHPRP